MNFSPYSFLESSASILLLRESKISEARYIFLYCSGVSGEISSDVTRDNTCRNILFRMRLQKYIHKYIYMLTLVYVKTQTKK